MASTVASVERLKEKIDTLTEEQAQALQTATYLGMTPDEATEYDHRRSRILTLIEELERLETAA